MMASPALSAWLSDLDAQKRSQAAIDDRARRWSRHPLITEVDERLAALPAPTAAAVLDVARAFMDREDDIAALVSDMLAGSRADPFSRPPFYPMSSEIHSGLVLFHNPDLTIALGVSGVDMLAAKKAGPRGATSIAFTGLTTMFRCLKAGDATVSFWEVAPICDDFVAAQAGKCRFVERRQIADGDEILFDGRYQSFVIEHAASDMLYLQAMVRRGAAPLTAEYDSKTMTFIGASSTDEASSRIQMMVSLLRTMGRDDAFPLIEEALASPHFYTRWHIMRELLAMDAEAALPALRRMATNDPHPEVRAAAQQTLELFFQDEGEDEVSQGDIRCRA